MSDEAQLTSVVVTLDDERSCTKAVRALRRQYPTATDMPIFVRAVNEQHRRKLASSSATALETGPEESALMLGGALLASLGTPKQEQRALDAEHAILVVQAALERLRTSTRLCSAAFRCIHRIRAPLVLARTRSYSRDATSARHVAAPPPRWCAIIMVGSRSRLHN